MKSQKIVIATLAAMFLILILVSPANACTKPTNSAKRIPFALTVYFVAASPGQTHTIGHDIYIKGGTTTAIALDGTLVSVSTNIYEVFNTVAGKGYGLGSFVDTYTNGIIGTGVMNGLSYIKTAVADFSSGTCTIVAHGSSDKYSSIIEVSTASWQPTTTPFPTIALTVTGCYIVET